MEHAVKSILDKPLQFIVALYVEDRWACRTVLALLIITFSLIR